jgi:hypothetical protein
VKDLGLPDRAQVDEVYQRAESLGLELCPADTAINLRLQNPTSESMNIAMESIADAFGRRRIFVFDITSGADFKLCLGSTPTVSDLGCLEDDQFVFRLPKKK